MTPIRDEPTYDDLRRAGSAHVVGIAYTVMTGAWTVAFNLFVSLPLAVVLAVALHIALGLYGLIHTAWKAARF